MWFFFVCLCHPWHIRKSMSILTYSPCSSYTPHTFASGIWMKWFQIFVFVCWCVCHMLPSVFPSCCPVCGVFKMHGVRLLKNRNKTHRAKISFVPSVHCKHFKANRSTLFFFPVWFIHSSIFLFTRCKSGYLLRDMPDWFYSDNSSWQTALEIGATLNGSGSDPTFFYHFISAIPFFIFVVFLHSIWTVCANTWQSITSRSAFCPCLNRSMNGQDSRNGLLSTLDFIEIVDQTCGVTGKRSVVQHRSDPYKYTPRDLTIWSRMASCVRCDELSIRFF